MVVSLFCCRNKLTIIPHDQPYYLFHYLIRSIHPDQLPGFEAFVYSFRCAYNKRQAFYVKIYNKFVAKAYILTKKEGGRHKGFSNNYKPQFFFRTMNVTGSIILPADVTFVLPGDNLNFQVNLVSGVPINLGLKFIMREGNLTIGAGVITKML